MIIPKKKFKSNEIFVNLKSNFKSQLVRCQKIIDDTNFDELVIRGIGKAIDRADRLAEQLNSNNFNTFEIKRADSKITVSEDANKKKVSMVDWDLYDPDDDKNFVKKECEIPEVTLVVRKNKLELEKLRQIRKNNLFK